MAIVITGRVIDRQSDNPVAELRVETIDKDPHYDQHLGNVERSTGEDRV